LDEGASIDGRPSGKGTDGVTGVRNSAGALSEVLSTVIDLPCERGGVCNCVVGVEKTRLGGVANEVSVVVSVGRTLSIEGRGGGGGINAFCGIRNEEPSGVAWGLVGKAGLCSPVIWGEIIARPNPFVS
jgi:hypothetical protein